QNEYIAPDQERLAWLTGFTGSAGTAIVLQNTAALFVDGRYVTQAADEVTPDYTVHLIPDEPATAWVNARAKGKTLGFDPWLHTDKQIAAWQKACPHVTFVPLTPNPIDALWQDRPQPPTPPAWIHPEAYAGQSWLHKITHLRQTLRDHNAEALLLTDPASLCWLLNLRGGDIPHTPLLLGYLWISQTEMILFTHPQKIPSAVHHERPALTVMPTASMMDILRARPALTLYDDGECPVALSWALTHKKAIPNPCQQAKAIKNPTEQNGMRAAHQRDGAAVTRALAWLKTAPHPITERDIEQQFLIQRQKEALFHDLSFPTIAGSGPHGAIIHYRATDQSCRTLNPAGDLVLIDSGAQYHDGTTDITRTLWIGTTPPPQEIKRLYTLVLMGHIRVATARFPHGTTGAQLDSLARDALWRAGLDYRHGTGHGVGAFLSVHEGPCGIGSRYHTTPLQAGMIVSNEPGYYRPGAFGIRLENLLLVRDDLPPPDGAEIPLLGFETLTRVPFELTLIDRDLLGEEGWGWVMKNNEHC
ncbi:MAG: M24 family metallopeptidase, partial [Alphaproteobacteria bacterium]